MVLNIHAGGMSKEDVEEIKKQQKKLAKKLEKENWQDFKRLELENQFEPSPEHIRSKMPKKNRTIRMRKDAYLRLEEEANRTGKSQTRLLEELILSNYEKTELEDVMYDRAFIEAQEEVVEIQKIVKMYEDNFTGKEIAKELDIQESKVFRVVKGLGLKHQDQKRLEDEGFKDEVVDLYYDGFTNPEIAKELKCSLITISKILRERKPDPQLKRAYQMREERRKERFEEIEKRLENQKKKNVEKTVDYGSEQ